MNRPPLISIVIAAYQCERFLAATLQSIRDQTLRDWECVVVDDGSTDRTSEIAGEHASADGRIRVLSQKNAGASAARNNGFANTSPDSEFIAFMDSDDVWLPDALESLSKALHESPEMIAAHGLAEFIAEDGSPMDPGVFAAMGRNRRGIDQTGRIRSWDLSMPTSFEIFLFRNTVYPPGVILIRRKCFEKAGLFDTSLSLEEDWDMLIRLSRQGDFRFLNKVVVLYRRHDSNASAQSAARTRQAIRILQHKTFFSAENDARQQGIVRKSWRGLQIASLSEKFDAILKQIAEGRIAAAGSMIPRLYVQAHRYLRGYPTIHGL